MDINEQIVHYYYNGWSRKDIAAKLGLTEIAVKKRLERIRKKREVKRWWKK